MSAKSYYKNSSGIIYDLSNVFGAFTKHITIYLNLLYTIIFISAWMIAGKN